LDYILGIRAMLQNVV